jgi:Na+/H+ antiporter NhaD/arsenite permease-like protein
MALTLAFISIFVLGYLFIALEHNVKIDKASSALLLGVVLWTLLIMGGHDLIDTASNQFTHFTVAEAESLTGKSIDQIKQAFIEFALLEHLGELASILFFLIGAMAIVEVVDMHGGFTVITDRIKTDKKVALLWIIALITFILSSVLDNLTTTIVMVSLLRKLIKDQPTRWLYVGIVIIAANSGGAWSPIGDVTTTMLWNGGQISALPIMYKVILPSLVSLFIPLIFFSFMLKGTVERPDPTSANAHGMDAHGTGEGVTNREKNIIFAVGVLGLLFVPVFKTITHLPPFMGMMLSLGILWVVTELLHKHREQGHYLSVVSGLRRIDLSGVLFFLGILLAISSLQTAGLLRQLALILDSALGNMFVLNIFIGTLSAIVDNVPLVAAAQGMYDIETSGIHAMDGDFWTMLAFCAGTGGSILIIGSASGVAAMGLERISFGWYMKKVSFLALLGYLAGCLLFILISPLFA